MVIGRTGDQLLTNEAGETTRYAQADSYTRCQVYCVRDGGDGKQGGCRRGDQGVRT